MEPKPAGALTAAVRRGPFLAALLLFAFALTQAGRTDTFPDFFIYRLGAQLAARGENPYSIPKVREHVAVQFPGDSAREFVDNCGYFLPPLAILVFLPFAALPWAAAKVAWAAAVGVAGFFIAKLPVLAESPDERPGTAGDNSAPPVPVWLLWVVPLVLVGNKLTLEVVRVGQFTPVAVGCVAAGLWAFGWNRWAVGAALWVVPFVKPHLALPLVPLAWVLGGWRPAALLVALVGGLNLAGAWLAGGSPLFLRDYFDFLPTARDAVAYNRVELNPEILSWNRLLFAAGGPLIELGIVGVLAGYLMWFGLVVGRCAMAGARPSAAWAVAASAVGAVLCAQALAYEALFLLLVVPWVRDLFAAGDRVRGSLAVALLALHMIPYRVMSDIGIEVHHPLGVVLLAALVLAGPTSGAASGVRAAPVR